MTVSEKIKIIDEKIEQNETQTQKAGRQNC